MPNLSKSVQKKLQTSAQACIDGMSEIRTKVEIDSQKIFHDTIEAKERLDLLKRTPAIARVVVESEKNGNLIELLVCPCTPPIGASKPTYKKTLPHDLKGIHLASYQSAMGCFASLAPGSSKDDFYVIAVEKLNPVLIGEGYDSVDTEFLSDKFKRIITLSSLREFLKPFSRSQEPEPDISWLDDDSTEQVSKITFGVRRKKKTSFKLSQIILNSEQDEISRAEIDSQIVILGAPGTGKTTALLQRLRNKVLYREDGLSEGEREALNRALGAGMDPRWILFTPTELLKQYLRNALDANNMTDLVNQMYTWDDYRQIIGRQSLGVLRTTINKSGFLLIPDEKVTAETTGLTTEARINSSLWCEEFSAFRKAALRERVKRLANRLSKSKNKELSAVGFRLLELTGNDPEINPASLLAEINDKNSLLIKHAKELDVLIEQETLKVCQELVHRIPDLKKGWAALLDSEVAAPDDIDDELDSEDEETEPLNQPKKIPGLELKKTVKRYCRNFVTRKKIDANSQFGRRVTFLSKGLTNTAAFETIGSNILMRQACLQLRASFKHYVNRIRQQYSAYRSQAIESKNGFYRVEGVNKSHIQTEELDLLIYSYLQTANELNEDRRTQRRFSDDLRDIFSRFCKTMVFVDEATDFSPLSLACMRLLTYPSFRSFFASGDINQRLTDQGIRSEAELHWAVPYANYYHFKTAYRQTRELYELGQAVLSLDGSAVAEDSEHNEQMIDEGVMPALAENLSTEFESAQWVGERICEILNQYPNDPPTIAIFVANADLVPSFAEKLRNTEAILNNSLIIEACESAKYVGQDFKICVYPIDFIKGLEFESVFFVGIDTLAKFSDKSFLRFLYVGATRASMFLGLTCEKGLPAGLQNFKSLFCSDWSSLESTS